MTPALLAVAAVGWLAAAAVWRLRAADARSHALALEVARRDTSAARALADAEADRASGERRAREAVEAQLAATLAALPKGAGVAMLRGEQDE